MNRKQLIELNEIADGAPVKFIGEPEFIEAPDGSPLGMETTPVHWAQLSGISVTAAEVRAAGLTATELPNLNIVEMD